MAMLGALKFDGLSAVIKLSERTNDYNGSAACA
jgi:hypothetical protein